MSAITKEDIDGIKQDLVLLKSALLGNDYNEYGVLAQLKSLREFKRKTEKYMYMLYGGAIAVSGLVSFVVTVIFKK